VHARPGPGPDRKGVPISEVSHPPRGASEPVPPPEFPAGPWIVVMGMHRSGTSALTGALGGLGLALPQPGDHWAPEPSNPEHYESLSMVEFDERLFEFLGGSWDGPPDLPTGWEARADVRAFDDEARRVARHAYPDDGPLVWKDPRACVLLPYWRRLLPEPMAAVLMWRTPTEVARSLHQRDGFSPALGTALWERYNRAALDTLEGTQVYVTSYDELLGDPVGLCRALGSWLDSLDGLVARRGRWDPDRATDVVTEDLRHQGPEPDEWLLDSQADLVDRLHQLSGPHQALPPADLAPPSPWATAVLDEHRTTGVLSRRIDTVQEDRQTAEEANQRLRAANEELEARSAQSRRAVQAMRASTSWRLTRPLRSLSAGRSRHQDAR